MRRSIFTAVALLLSTAACAEWDAEGFRAQKVSLIAENVTVKEAYHHLLGDKGLKVSPRSYGTAVPDKYLQARIDVMISKMPMEHALRTIAQLGGGYCEPDIDAADGKVFLLLSKQGAAVEQARWRARETQEFWHRKRLADDIEESTTATMHLLDIESLTPRKKQDDLPAGAGFEISPYGREARILQSKELNGEENARLIAALAQLLRTEERKFGALCHFPIYGVEIKRGDEVLFRSSFCWACTNYFVEYPVGQAGWLGLPDAGLRKLFEELMPISDEIREQHESFVESLSQ
ncbi:hypothetical protein Mal64_26450 [Pseudobythopirellula maris]|uniref:Lipoprotein n=1 Tax=Pseudobythopirellula maris TaxID=2527991 RepID=A0A5C5ZJV7_9BACT|nr:hypothetical protein [Pseudobythopirellula maris]TWT87111.1 hypothetical protein Mal64_26450 [Pseudobythopirellula maris]